MGRALVVYGHVLRAQVRSQVQYRLSFALDVLGSTLITALDLVTVFVLFSVSGGLGGFGAPMVVLVAALSSFAFALADLIAGNVDYLREYIRSGRFDSLLLRPMSSLGQLIALTFALRRVGRVVQSGAFYAVSLLVLDVPWDPARVALAVAAPVAGMVFFVSLFVIGAAAAFWWVESGEVANAFTYGGRDFTAYPVTMYEGWFRGLFAFGLGFAFVAYMPALALLDLPDPLGAPPWLRWACPSTALLAACAAALLWRTGVRHYRSTGS